MADSLVPLRIGTARAAAPDVVPTTRRLYIETFGCQMNVSDSDLVVGLLRRQGYARTDRIDEADLVLLNTCAVREKAEDKVFARTAELTALKARASKRLVLGVIGCMAEHLKDQIRTRAPTVDLIAGPDSYRRLGDLVARAAEAPEQRDPFVDVRLDRRETYEGLDAAPSEGGVSGFITIQRGCDKFCTFCVVPLTRGRERALPPREVLRQARALVDTGCKEVTLLGQTVNSYRHEEARFSDLLRAVARTDKLSRLRFTSPYPVDFSDDVIDAIATEPKVCKHVHLPLQSGSDAILSRMERGYSYAEFVRIVRALRAAIPDIAITTDIITGFCGETEADHAATLAAMEQLRFDSAYMFAYSERSGTLAHRKLLDDVTPEIKQRRLREVIELQSRHSIAAQQRLVGRIEPVLIHGPSKRNPDELLGRTDTFKAVIVRRGSLQPGDLVDVRIDRATQATLFGTPLTQ